MKKLWKTLQRWLARRDGYLDAAQREYLAGATDGGDVERRLRAIERGEYLPHYLRNSWR